MSDLDQQASDMIDKLEAYERHWHLIKIAFYAIIGVVIILTNLYTFHRLYDNSDKNRQLLRCTVVTLTKSDITPAEFQSELQKCLDYTK